jgi:tetraacyldisaccharide 4'-kinase
MKRAANIALAPLSLVYGAAVNVRSALYRNGIFKTHSVGVPVISVGNITTGGTGKTPLVEWIARNLWSRDHRVCLLTRGYRRADPGKRVLVSDGKQILADINQAGDEAMMLARALLGKAAVVCDADRVAGARWAIENLKPDVLLLDDGFQHRRLARDLEIVTLDATNPWSNGWLLPAGRLREPVSSLSRADCFVVTRATSVDENLAESVRRFSDAPIFFSTMVAFPTNAVSNIGPLEGCDGIEDKAILLNRPVAAFCGVGNPEAFRQQLHDEKIDVVVFESFRDHHKYAQSDIDRVTKKALEAGAQVLITTAKDAVKLEPLRLTLPCYLAEVEIEISDADKLLALIEAAIEAKRSGRNPSARDR